MKAENKTTEIAAATIELTANEAKLQTLQIEMADLPAKLQDAALQGNWADLDVLAARKLELRNDIAKLEKQVKADTLQREAMEKRNAAIVAAKNRLESYAIAFAATLEPGAQDEDKAEANEIGQAIINDLLKAAGITVAPNAATNGTQTKARHGVGREMAEAIRAAHSGGMQFGSAMNEAILSANPEWSPKTFGTQITVVKRELGLL